MPPFWNCTWQPSCVYVTSFCPTQNWQDAEKPATESFKKVSKVYFFQPIILYTIFTGIIFGFGTRLVREYGSRAAITQSSNEKACPLDRKISWKCGPGSKYYSIWQPHYNFGVIWRRISWGKPALQRLKIWRVAFIYLFNIVHSFYLHWKSFLGSDLLF